MKSSFFFLIFFLFIFSLHGLFYSRVIKKLLMPARVKKILSILLWVNFSFNLLYLMGRYTDLITTKLYYLFSISIGITFMLFLYLIVHEILYLVGKTVKKMDRSKRNFIKKSTDGMLLALSTGYIGAGIYEGSKEPAVNIIDFGHFDFSIVQISDFHIGGIIDKKFVEASVKKINGLNPDIVFITGDLVDTNIDQIQDAIKKLDGISSKYGIYYVLGNHEYFHHPQKIIDFMKKTQIKLLLNENVIIDDLKLNVVGVTDLFGYRTGMLVPDINKAYQGCNQTYQTILLAHQPKFIEHLKGYTPDLMLCGHTHGGQIWPFNYLVRLQQPYVKGLYKLSKGSHIYINSGIGFWGPPMRLNSQAEITYII